MVPLNGAMDVVRAAFAEWTRTRLADVSFGRRDAVIIGAIVFVGLSISAVLLRSLVGRPPGRYALTLPAVLPSTSFSRLAVGRHLVIVLFLLGIPFFAVALADPFTAFTRQEVTYPGRRIALMIDASASMLTRVPSAKPAPSGGGRRGGAFFTTVAAAETFIRARMSGRYRDLIGLVEFGDEAYVITPFTTDYNNVLLSLSLIGDVSEVAKFPDQGTTIVTALERGVQLFKAFDFLNASGNLLVMFTDGQDRQVVARGVTADEILAQARQARIPVYMIRTPLAPGVTDLVPDGVWKPAVESTGGKFYAATDDSTILRAVHEIDSLAGGSVAIKEYSQQQPRFAGFALLAAGLWTLAAALKLGVPYFQTFP